MLKKTASDIHLALRSEALAAPESGIVEVVNRGRLKEGLIPLWVGEGDLPTPSFIAEAATRSLAAGETFYTWQRGIPELREALAKYHAGLYRRGFITAERFFVTGSGMQAIQIAIALVVGKDDEILVPSPAWPNAAAAAGVAGGRAVEVPLVFSAEGWTLDIEALTAAIRPRTRAIFVNSPSNPTGWVASREELQALLTLARKHGLWIVADEVYGRFAFDEDRAPSFYDIMEADDRILFVNTFSKNWAMTGWRIGWIGAHPSLGQTIENLIQYSTSGVAAFMQRAAVTALERGEDFLAHQISRANRGRDVVTTGLEATGRVRFARPRGAFYLFFSIDGQPDARKTAIRMVEEALVGLAPGTAFGQAGEGFLRLCFARSADQLEEATRRLARWITAQP